MCHDSFPAGAELWRAHTTGRTTAEQQQVFAIPCPAEELFHVGKDPHQLKNLAGNRDFEAIRKEMAESLHAFQKKTHDPLLKHVGRINAGELNYVK
jgi:arylsulfatase